jgi:hypothetical protein
MNDIQNMLDDQGWFPAGPSDGVFGTLISSALTR